MTEAESAEQIDEAAFAWVARLDREGHSPEIEQELQAWLEGDERRRGALLRAEALWGKLDRAALLHVYASRGSEQSFPITRRVAMWGSAVAASGIFAAWYFSGREAQTATTTSLETVHGEVRSVPLADGSVVVMNTDSHVHIFMDSQIRRVQLASGEAWFDVEKNPNRPFVVEADRVRVQAVGTAFSVRRRVGGADVCVTEGIVEAWVEGTDHPRMRLEAGQQAFISEAKYVVAKPVHDDDIDRRLAWRSGKIDLNGETLADAVAEFNRYNTRKLTLANETLAHRHIYGVFRAHDPEGFARAVSVSLATRVRFRDDEIVIGGRSE